MVEISIRRPEIGRIILPMSTDIKSLSQKKLDQELTLIQVVTLNFHSAGPVARKNAKKSIFLYDKY